MAPIYVLIVGLIGACHTCFNVVGVYNNLVQNYDIPRNLRIIHWSYVLDPVTTPTPNPNLQTFCAYRIYILSKRSILLPLLVEFLTLVQLGVGCFTTGFAFEHAIWPVVEARVSWAVSTWLFMMAGTDPIITVTIVSARSTKVRFHGYEFDHRQRDLVHGHEQRYIYMKVPEGWTGGSQPGHALKLLKSI
ncbi:BZ3500_MvSof-1268-A1-R1_Chr6-3g08889 [Microbotryum saponariae]|uniref:BZ3500_MvSof-1268-A1-R1_Chr6-3g08889 protein n=1 Tax=Microbotryum saponariae TaxID=289078 RepID=A0A2X0LPS6_9BASI|nr:BZ3500_MvSof-1268-A1-R1_Chr6-3g08889 [Microbotryum saponariae]SDA07490.1 BZ3501_MvSof-1269-A2-R1_Chr6-2g08592 [Microbotryum saponariae]